MFGADTFSTITTLVDRQEIGQESVLGASMPLPSKMLERSSPLQLPSFFTGTFANNHGRFLGDSLVESIVIGKKSLADSKRSTLSPEDPRRSGGRGRAVAGEVNNRLTVDCRTEEQQKALARGGAERLSHDNGSVQPVHRKTVRNKCFKK